VESASGPRLPGDDPLVVAKESANLDSTKTGFEDFVGRLSAHEDDLLEPDLTGQFVPVLMRRRDKSLQTHEVHSAQ